MPNSVSRWVISANRLIDGATVFQTAEGWSSDFKRAHFFEAEQSRDHGLEKALQSNEVVGVDSVAVDPANKLIDIREQMRLSGPSMFPTMRARFLNSVAGVA